MESLITMIFKIGHIDSSSTDMTIKVIRIVTLEDTYLLQSIKSYIKNLNGIITHLKLVYSTIELENKWKKLILNSCVMNLNIKWFFKMPHILISFYNNYNII
jgi:nitrate reductase NapAB chaperone NapD